MANESGKLMAASKKVQAAQKGANSAATDDAHLDEKRHDRSYNPADEAERCSISAKLNEDAAKYRKGPGPL